jgi:hypothetical protein
VHKDETIVCNLVSLLSVVKQTDDMSGQFSCSSAYQQVLAFGSAQRIVGDRSSNTGYLH